jgi:hypothetical protein
VIFIVGNLFDGKGSLKHIAAAVAWGNVPSLIGLPILMVRVLVFRNDLFTGDVPQRSTEPVWWVLHQSLWLIEHAFGLWCLVLLSHTIAAAQGFISAWRGFWTLILAGVFYACIFIIFLGGL